MLSNYLSFPVMLILSVLQTVAVSRLNILSGSADIVLLSIIAWGVISLMTAMPAIAVVIGYLIIALITWIIHKRIWQSPILAALLSVIIGSVAKFIVDIIGLQFIGVGFRLITGIREILAPNMIMNLFFIFPIYLLISDLANWIVPKEAHES